MVELQIDYCLDSGSTLLEERRIQTSWSDLLREATRFWASVPNHGEPGETPTLRCLIRARQIAEQMDRATFAAPTHVVSNNDGGLVFEMRDEDRYAAIEILSDGAALAFEIRDGRIVRREELPSNTSDESLLNNF